MNPTRITPAPNLQMHVTVNGVYEWRDAVIEHTIERGIGDRRGQELVHVPRVCPVLANHEKLSWLNDGTCFITS